MLGMTRAGTTRAARAKYYLALCLLTFSFVLGPGSERPASAQEAAPLRFCADPDNLPFSSANEAMPGLYVELGRELARELGRPFQPVWVPTYYAKRQVRMKLLAGQCDGFIGLPDDAAFMAPRVVLSSPFLRLGYALVVPKGMRVADLRDLSGRRVAVQFSTAPQDLAASRADIQAVTATSVDEAMQDIVDGKADAAFVWGASAGWLNKTRFQDAFEVVPVEEAMAWAVGIGFARGQTALRDQVNGALAGMAPLISALASKYGVPQDRPPNLATEGAAPSPAAPDPGPGGGEHRDAHASAADGSAGHKLFNDNCAHCHGPDAVQGERRRNLRLLQRRYGDDVRQAFMTTVTHGRVNKGMPNWSGILSDEEFNEILAFLLSVQEQ